MGTEASRGDGRSQGGMRESRGGQYLEKESWWWNPEVKQAVQRKKEAFKQWERKGSEEDRTTYREMTKASKQMCAIVGYEDLYQSLET